VAEWEKECEGVAEALNLRRKGEGEWGRGRNEEEAENECLQGILEAARET